MRCLFSLTGNTLGLYKKCASNIMKFFDFCTENFRVVDSSGNDSLSLTLYESITAELEIMPIS